MYKILATLALATPLLSYAAIPDVHTTTLNITSISDYDGSTALNVLSDQGGVTKFSTAVWQQVHELSTGGLGLAYEFQMNLTIAPTAGRIITGYSISGLTSGTLQTPAKPPEANNTWRPGAAQNTANIYLTDTKGQLLSKRLTDITSPAPMELGVYNLALDRATQLTFATHTGVWAEYATWWEEYTEHKLGSFAAVNFSAPTLTIYTALAPVPEPETWGMLLAGVGLIGIARRRAKR